MTEGPRFPEPTDPAGSRAEVLLGYLDYLRGSLAHRVAGLDEQAARTSLVPSGWTPLELVVHLTHVERRWLAWGFEGRGVDDPWGDERDGRWHLPADRSVADVLAALAAQGVTTSAIVQAHDLDEVGQPGERWDGAAPPTLERVLLHLLQEHARHLGHLDVVTELAGGPTGE